MEKTYELNIDSTYGITVTPSEGKLFFDAKNGTNVYARSYSNINQQTGGTSFRFTVNGNDHIVIRCIERPTMFSNILIKVNFPFTQLSVSDHENRIDGEDKSYIPWATNTWWNRSSLQANWNMFRGTNHLGFELPPDIPLDQIHMYAIRNGVQEEINLEPRQGYYGAYGEFEVDENLNGISLVGPESGE